MEKNLKGALVGYGFIASQGHIPAYLERKDIEISAIADICPERREAAQKALPRARIYETYEALLDSEASSIDFVDICTPPVFHGEIALSALQKGLHVLCEKPITADFTQAKKMKELALKNQKVFFPCHNYKHAPVVKAISEVLRSGELGEIRSVTLNTFRNTHAKGVTEWKTHWRRDQKWSAGGIVMDHGSHSFYLTFDWLNAYPQSVSANLFRLNREFNTEDNASVVVYFPKSAAHVHLTWTAGVRKVIYSVQGTQGAITVDDDRMEIALMRKDQGPDIGKGAVKWETEVRSISSSWMDSSHVSWYGSLYDEFKNAIAKNDYFGKEAQDSMKCMELIMAAYQSASLNGTQVFLDQTEVLSPPSLSFYEGKPVCFNADFNSSKVEHLGRC